MPNTEQLLYQIEKSSHWRFSIKPVLLKIFAILTGKHLCEILKNTYFKEHLHMAASKLILKAVPTTFLLVCFSHLKESTCETRKNVFYFTSKALFVLEIIKF